MISFLKKNIHILMLFTLPIMILIVMSLLGVGIPYWMLYVFVLVWIVWLYIYIYHFDIPRNGLYVLYDRRVYYALFAFLAIMLFNIWFSHQYICILLLALWWLTMRSYEVRWYVLLWYILMFLLLDVYAFYDQTYIIVPYIYTYVTIFSLARIWEHVLEKMWSDSWKKA